MIKVVEKWLVVTCLLLACVGLASTANAQRAEDQPKVIKAVAPIFVPFIYNKTGVAHVEMEVRINKDGMVTSTRVVSFSKFTDLSVDDAAKRWVFDKSKSVGERKAVLRFVFRIMPTDTVVQDLTPIFSAPFEIEVRSPIIESPKTSSPAPIPEGNE